MLSRRRGERPSGGRNFLGTGGPRRSRYEDDDVDQRRGPRRGRNAPPAPSRSGRGGRGAPAAPAGRRRGFRVGRGNGDDQGRRFGRGGDRNQGGGRQPGLIRRLKNQDPQALDFINELRERIRMLERDQATRTGRQIGGASPNRGRFTRTRRDNQRGPAPPLPLSRQGGRGQGPARRRERDDLDYRDIRTRNVVDRRERRGADSGNNRQRFGDGEAPRQRRRLEEEPRRRGGRSGGGSGGRGGRSIGGGGRGGQPPIRIHVRN